MIFFLVTRQPCPANFPALHESIPVECLWHGSQSCGRDHSGLRQWQDVPSAGLRCQAAPRRACIPWIRTSEWPTVTLETHKFVVSSWWELLFFPLVLFLQCLFYSSVSICRCITTLIVKTHVLIAPPCMYNSSSNVFNNWLTVNIYSECCLQW